MHVGQIGLPLFFDRASDGLVSGECFACQFMEGVRFLGSQVGADGGEISPRYAELARALQQALLPTIEAGVAGVIVDVV